MKEVEKRGELELECSSKGINNRYKAVKAEKRGTRVGIQGNAEARMTLRVGQGMDLHKGRKLKEYSQVMR